METNKYVVVCKVCGRKITKGNGVRIKADASSLTTMDTNKKLVGGYGFIHEECRSRFTNYHCVNYSTLGSKETACFDNAKMGIEIELNTRCEKVQDYLETTYQLKPQRDCSVYVEYATDTYKSLSCISKMLQGLESFDYTDYASTHFTLSNNNSISINQFLVKYRKSILNYLQDAIKTNYNVSDIFGRGFNRWAKELPSETIRDITSHSNRYYWVNLTHTDKIEFRLFKFNGNNATQLLTAFKWFKLFYTKCGKAIEKYGNNKKAVEYMQKWIDRNIHTLKA